MDTIKLLLAHADRRVTNLVEVAVLDVCYNRAAVQSTRTTRLDEFIRQGSLWDFDLIVVGVENLFADRNQRSWAGAEEVVNAIRTIRSQSSSPIIALCSNREAHQALLEAGAHSVVGMPFNSEDLKVEVRPLLDLNGSVEPEENNRWAALGSLFKGLQKAKTGN